MSRTTRLALVLTAAVAPPACASGGETAAGNEGPTVVASFYPLFEAANRVGGDGVAVTNLTPAGVEPHDLELTSREVDDLLDADVVLYLGQGFQPAVEEIAGDREGVTVDLLDGRPLVEGGEAGHEEEGGDEHAGEGLDPHVWLDPVLMNEIVGEVSAALTRADPSGADLYRENAEAYSEEITSLHDRFQASLQSCDRHLIVTAHAAFGYLAARYGLRQEAITGLSPEAEPDPSRIAELADLVAREGVTTIFTESLLPPEVADVLAREAGVETAVLDPLEGLSGEQASAGEDYVSVMDGNRETLARALGCQ